MQIGYSESIITPETCDLAGYAQYRKKEGVNDDLFARVLVLYDEKKQSGSAWVSLDLIGVDHLLMHAVKQCIDEQGLPIDDLLLFASHTHASCAGVLDTVHSNLSGMVDVFGLPRPDIIQDIALKVGNSIQEALRNCCDFVLNYYKGSVAGFAASRHNLADTVDQDLWVVEVNRRDNKKILLVHFACHPTILHEANTKISADFVGVVDRYFKGRYDMTFFINGACADISTRFTRHESTIEELERLGHILCRAIEDSLMSLQCQKTVHEFSKHDISVIMKKKKQEHRGEIKAKIQQTEAKLASLSETASIGERRLLESYLEGYQGRLQSILNDDGSTEERVVVSILKVNDMRFVCIPGELSNALAMDIKAQGVGVFTLVNGYHSYITSKDSYEHNYYEAHVSFYEKGEAEKMIDLVKGAYHANT